MESECELDRMRLYQLRQEHPEWILERLAQALGRCLSWVKKWLKRFREAEQPSPELFKASLAHPIAAPVRS